MSVVSIEQNARGLDVLTRRWPAVEPVPGSPTGGAFGQLLLVHGIGEHSGRYERTGSCFADAGFDVRAVDLPGHGGTGGRRAYLERWDDYLGAVSDALAQMSGPRPLVMLGHSMGALIALTYVLAEPPRTPLPDLLVLSAVPVRGNVPLFKRVAAPILARIAPTLEIDNGLRGEQLSRDPEVARAYFADPLVYPRSTTRLGADLFGAMARARRQLASRSRLPVPTLVLHGAEDTISWVEGSALVGALDGAERRVLPGLRHEIFNEPEGPAIVEDVVAWIRAQDGDYSRP